MLSRWLVGTNGWWGTDGWFEPTHQWGNDRARWGDYLEYVLIITAPYRLSSKFSVNAAFVHCLRHISSLEGD